MNPFTIQELKDIARFVDHLANAIALDKIDKTVAVESRLKHFSATWTRIPRDQIALNFAAHEYRFVTIEQPRRRPLKREEVKAWMRHPEGTVYLVHGLSNETANVIGWLTWQQLMDMRLEQSDTMHGPWEPCSKPIEV